MITVIGLGFVGLTTALGFCQKGYSVYGYDASVEKYDLLRKGSIPFYEPHLPEMLKKHSGTNFHLIGSEELKRAINDSQVVFYCVGTPDKDDGRADLTYLLQAVKETLQVIEKGSFKTLVIKSTVPPSTTSEIVLPYIERLGFKVGKNIGLATNPEFLREGYAFDDFINPDRIVIGYVDEESGKVLKSLYEPFKAPVHLVSPNTAEYIKYLSNTLLSTLISFANEQSLIAYKIGDIDLKKTFKILHMDKRWFGSPAPMTEYVYPGCGFGGYCLPKDTKALVGKAIEKGVMPTLLNSVLDVNKNIREFVVSQICDVIPKKDNIGILGLSFKPNCDDVRCTPAYDIIRLLLERGYRNLIAYDPLSNNVFHSTYQLPINYAPSLEDICAQTKYLVILTAWEEFKTKRSLYKDHVVFDFRYTL